MRKNVLTTFMLAGLFFWANAQVGINQPDPKATLHIDKSTNPAVADGVLVPRVTVANINAKTYGLDQNGALVFVTDATGATGSTANISGRGFYYYDAPNSIWKVAVTSNNGNGNFTPKSIILPVPLGTTGAFDWSQYTSYNYFAFYKIENAPSPFNLQFPPAALFANRTIYITNYGVGSIITFKNVPSELIGPGVDYIIIGGSEQYYSDGAKWYIMGGRS